VCCGARAERGPEEVNGRDCLRAQTPCGSRSDLEEFVEFGTPGLNVRRSVSIVVSSLIFAAVLAIGQVASQDDTAFASSWLPYHQGYYTIQGWLCYGWPNGTWHCTRHWYRTNAGTLISEHTAWVPNIVDQSGWNKAVPDSQRDAVPHQDAAHKPPPPAAKPAPPAPKPYVPPAPPAPPPTASQQAVIAAIQAVFGGYAASALAIARCESGYNPSAVNPIIVLGSHAQGVFQILYPSTWNTTSYAGQSPFNYDANIHAAYQIFSRDGFSWREWQCQP
jgi:hypothetical protein